MQYLVKTGGEVHELQGKTYVVNAASKEEACALATAQFSKEYGAVNVTAAGANNRTFRAYLALTCIIVADLLLTMIEWTDGHNQYNLVPDLFSGLFAVGFYVAFLFKYKGINRIADQRVIDWALDISSIVLLASFLKVFLVQEHIPIFSIMGKELLGVDIDSRYIIAFAVILSWVGVKFVSVICMGLAGFLAVGQFITISDAMHMWGFLYIILVFVGISLYATVEPAFIEASPAFAKWLVHGVSYLKDDIKSARSSAKKIQKGMTEKARIFKGDNIKKIEEKEDD